MTPCKQIQLLSRIKTLNGPRVRGISPVGKEKVYEKMICRRATSKFRVKDWTSKRRCKRWSWRWWRRWWWTAMCDRWKWRRLCLTKLLNGSSNDKALQTPWRRRTPAQSSIVPTVLCSTDAAACRWADVHRWWRDAAKGERRAAECDGCQSPLQICCRESRRQRVGLDSRRVVN